MLRFILTDGTTIHIHDGTYKPISAEAYHDDGTVYSRTRMRSLCGWRTPQGHKLDGTRPRPHVLRELFSELDQ